MAKINDFDAHFAPGQKAAATASGDHSPEGTHPNPVTEPPVAGATPPGATKTGAVERNKNRSAWYAALGLAEPMIGALASSPGILSSERDFAQSAMQLSGSIQEVAKAIKARYPDIPPVVATMVAAPLCAASWRLQIEHRKSHPESPAHLPWAPQLDAKTISDVAIRLNEAMGEESTFPAGQISHIARRLIENPGAAQQIGINFRETLPGITGIALADDAASSKLSPQDASSRESHEYFLARLAAFDPARIGEALHAAKKYMEPVDRDGVTGWHTLAFWGDSAKDMKSREMLTMALATQLAIGDDWFFAARQKNPGLCQMLVTGGRKGNTEIVATAARQYADRVESGTHMDLAETDKLSTVMMTAMREAMTNFHDVRKNVFDATDNMLKGKYPEAKTVDDIKAALQKEFWGDRIKSAFQAGKILREGIFTGIRENATPMEMSTSMKIRAAAGVAVAPLFKKTNAPILAAAFPGIAHDTTAAGAEQVCIQVTDWVEKTVRDLSATVVEAADIPKPDRAKMQGRTEKVLQEALEHSDVVPRCARQNKASEIFPEMVRELRMVMQTTAGMLPAPIFESCHERLETALQDTEQSLIQAFHATAIVQSEPIMENEAEREAGQKSSPAAGSTDQKQHLPGNEAA
jgi:hypothetical protein